MDYLTDTTFLIDIWRERDKSSVALRFARAHEHSVVGLPWVAKGEFLRGAMLAGQSDADVNSFLQAFIVVWPTDETLRRYALLYKELRRNNQLIGPNDLWIAACALERRLPLLTRNPNEFSRVNALEIIDYRNT